MLIFLSIFWYCLNIKISSRLYKNTFIDDILTPGQSKFRYQYVIVMFSGYQYLYWWDQCRYKYLSHQYQKQLPILFKILIDGIFDANLNSCLIVLSVESRKLIVFNQTNAWSPPSLDKYDNAIKKTWYWNFWVFKWQLSLYKLTNRQECQLGSCNKYQIWSQSTVLGLSFNWLYCRPML